MGGKRSERGKGREGWERMEGGRRENKGRGREKKENGPLTTSLIIQDVPILK